MIRSPIYRAMVEAWPDTGKTIHAAAFEYMNLNRCAYNEGGFGFPDPLQKLFTEVGVCGICGRNAPCMPINHAVGRACEDCVYSTITGGNGS